MGASKKRGGMAVYNLIMDCYHTGHNVIFYNCGLIYMLAHYNAARNSSDLILL